MVKRAVLLAAAVWAMALTSASATVYVKCDSTGVPDGKSWQTAYHKIQDGLNSASAGDEVWVAAGTYVENITLKAGVKLNGGYSGEGDARDSSAHETIVDGNQSGSVVTVQAGADTDTVIDGFTIRNGGGRVDAGGSKWGGGIYAASASPTISHNRITGNSLLAGTHYAYGAGVYLAQSTNPVVVHNEISGNSANGNGARGIGVCCTESGGTISDNVISDNSVNTITEWAWGGGIYCYNSTTTMLRNTICRNATSAAGGIVGGAVSVYCSRVNGATTEISDNVIIGNGYSGIDCERCSPIISRNRIADTVGTSTVLPYCIKLSESGATITGNTISSSTGTGVSMYSSGYDSYGLQITGNTFDCWKGVEISCPGSDTISGNTFRNSQYGAIVARATLVTIQNNTVTGNSNHSEGYVVYVTGPPFIEGITVSAVITGNTVTDSPTGGIGCSSQMSKCSITVSGNTVSRIAWGPAIGVCGGLLNRHDSDVTIANNTVTDNNAIGISCAYADGVIANNVVAHNTVSRVGDASDCAVSVSYGPTVITNNTIVGNTCGTGHGALYTSDGPSAANNIICFNDIGVAKAPVLYHNCVYGNTVRNYGTYASPGATDFSADPMFVDSAASNFHLKVGSRCINGGANRIEGLPATDIDGLPRVMDGTVDVGAYEFEQSRSTVAGAKGLPDGSSVYFANAVVSAAFPGFFYIEASDRTNGLRVDRADHGLLVGVTATVTGIIRTNSDGERYVDAAYAVADGAGSVEPVMVTAKAMGGADAAFDATTGAGQRGVEDGKGPNTIGLLMKTTGRVTAVGSDFFYIDDGTNAHDASIFVGVKVLCGGLSKPKSGDYVYVTGISTITQLRGRYFRAIRARDIQTIAM